LAQADWVSTKPGGEGAVRELCDFILKARAT
jgi:3-deoxy-D-manno-octulosonate 8-phosphate phosphatase KdsC-like HAD superfamily phosphatase